MRLIGFCCCTLFFFWNTYPICFAILLFLAIFRPFLFEESPETPATESDYSADKHWREKAQEECNITCKIPLEAIFLPSRKLLPKLTSSLGVLVEYMNEILSRLNKLEGKFITLEASLRILANAILIVSFSNYALVNSLKNLIFSLNKKSSGHQVFLINF